MMDIKGVGNSAHLSYVIIILVSFITLTIHAQKDGHPYESLENACSNCTCIEKETNQPRKFYALDCVSKNFSQILAGYPPSFDLTDKGTIMDISYSGNEIPFLNQLPATEVLVYFSCRHCGIKEISAEVFIDVPMIYRVDLSWNELSDLIPEIFKGRYNRDAYEPIGLVELDLSYNLLETLEPRLFEHVKGLRVLNLEHNKLNFEHPSTIDALATLKNVEKLNLAHTGIENLPAKILNNNLVELNIYGNKFLTVPESLSLGGVALKWLNVGGNLIEEIDDGNFTGMTSLRTLHMSDMEHLEYVHRDAFSQMTTLESLFCRNNTKLTSIDIGSLHYPTIRTLDISNCSLITLEITQDNADHSDDNDTIPLLFSNLQTLKIDNNPWHCNCSLFKSLQRLMKFDESDFQSEHTARCSTPYELTSDLLVDITINKLCLVSNVKKPREPGYDPPPFLRPRSILFSLLSILIVVLIGLCIGFAIVLIKKKLKQNEVGFSSPIRYTTVRNSTISVA
ncbi:leucine-rich repeat-containing protein 70-like [Bradysia coprophila]|uniref:leucine-rich repeat-containing protein 70-like n=1 Tax=Bradysia coprophila TaxID=38358 RepID=UPI00187DB1AB|nr:leucine-rich repeat-containing protein 70-like [Bradysia coprophila]